MEPSKDTLDRIFSAADSLYEQAGHAAFPTVDAVRKTARVNMNDASAGMKQWRYVHTAKVVPVVQVPERVQQAGGTALAVLWREAQELAHESLRAAQAGWEVERGDAETLNKQMADAYEAQAAELDATQAGVVQLTADIERVRADNARLDGELADTRSQLAAALAANERTEVRAIEIERRAAELRTELDHAHQLLVEARADLVGMRNAHVVALGKMESERDQIRKEFSRMQEEAAILRGQADTLNRQNVMLMRSVSTRKPAGEKKDTR